jgi:hypothetical protein
MIKRMAGSGPSRDKEKGENVWSSRESSSRFTERGLGREQRGKEEKNSPCQCPPVGKVFVFTHVFRCVEIHQNITLEFPSRSFI